MRLALVSPLPPSATGIADYTVDVARSLASLHDVDLFHDQTEVEGSLPAPVFGIREIEARHAASPYGAVIYQMGNAPAHDFMYEWMKRVPGAVVLHDLVLHHAFARRYLESAASLAYAADPSSREKRRKAEMDHALYGVAVDSVHPGLGERLKEAHFNTAGNLLPYAYPLFEPALVHAHAAGAHNSYMVEAIRAARPELPCFGLAMPVFAEPVPSASVGALRSRLGLGPNERVVGSFGLVTREKRIETVARAFKRVNELHPDLRLLLAGHVTDEDWLGSTLERAGVSGRAIITGRLSAADFETAIELSEVVVHLRYPTARETSAALLKVMARGRPVIVSDIANQSDIPDDAVKRVDMSDEEGGLARALDELIGRPAVAAALGRNARRFTDIRHSESRTLETYGTLLKSVRPHYSPSFP